MVRTRCLLAALAAPLVAIGGGCASIISGRTAPVKIDSHPPQAHVSVRDHEGMEVASATTPAMVSLKRGRTWLRPAKYTATISKPGYETARVPIRSTLNPWLVGNVAAGGVVGLAIDGTTGAGWKPKPGEIVQTLQPASEPYGPADEGLQLTAAETPVKNRRPPTSPPVRRVASGSRKSSAR
jgi:hypothetical protein